LKRLGTFKTFKNLFQNNNEKRELLNPVKILFLISKVPPGARGPQSPPLATPLIGNHTSIVKSIKEY